MTERVATTFAKALRARAQRLGQGRAGIAAVEFALILPLMLALYFGCVVLAQGFEVARKTQLLSRTLADLTAQTLPTGTQTSPTLQDADIVNIFSASTAVLYPFTGSPNMTVTEVIFDNNSSSDKTCCVAKVMWSARSGSGGTLRQCATLTQSANGVNGSTTIPTGFYPASSSNNSGPDNYLIVADVSYSYSPGVGFAPFAWNQAPNNGAGYTITQTTYMTPRYGATSPINWTPGGTISSSNYVTCTPNNP